MDAAAVGAGGLCLRGGEIPALAAALSIRQGFPGMRGEMLSGR
jgi:hypothetical protein